MHTHLRPSSSSSSSLPRSRRRTYWLLGLLLTVALPTTVPATETPPPTSVEAGPSADATFAFARAKLLADRGDLAAAVEAYDEALKLGGDAYSLVEAAKFQLYLAQIAREGSTQSRHVDRAAELVDRAFQAAPGNHDVLRIYADVHWRRTDKDPEALGRAQAAFEILAEDGDLQAMTSLAQIYLWQRRADEAADLLLKTADQAPRNRMIQGMLVEALLGAGRDREAEDALVVLLELEPGRIEARVRLADLLSRREEHLRAIEVLQAAPSDLRDRLRIRQLMAREYHLAGRHHEALAISDEMLKDDPRSPGFFRLRMSILVALTRYDEAQEVLESQLSEDDAEQRAQDAMLLARLKERVGRAEEAEGLLRREMASAPDAMKREMSLALAGVLQRSGDPAAAAELVEPLVASAELEKLPVFSQSLAELQIDLGRIDDAVRLMDDTIGRLEASDAGDVARALRIRQLLDLTDAGRWQEVLDKLPLLDTPEAPDEARRAAAQLRADALAAVGRWDEAIAQLSQDDLPPELRAKRLQLMLHYGRDADAREELRKLAESGEPQDLVLVARVLQSENLHAEAVPYLEQVVAADDEALSARFMLGAALERSGRFGESAAAFEALLERAPHHVPTLNYLGYMWAERSENLDRALEFILRAVASDPDNGAYVDSLGWAYFQLGRFAEARQHLEWAAKLEREDPTVFHHLGDAYSALGLDDEARDAYEHALELDAAADETQALSESHRADVENKLEQLERSGP